VPHNILAGSVWRQSIQLDDGMKMVWRVMRDAHQQQQQQQQQQKIEL
jgi:hypothetical protein